MPVVTSRDDTRRLLTVKVSDPWSVEELARRAGLSRSGLADCAAMLVKACTSVSTWRRNLSSSSAARTESGAARMVAMSRAWSVFMR